MELLFVMIDEDFPMIALYDPMNTIGSVVFVVERS
jgi:hypothetical protein